MKLPPHILHPFWMIEMKKKTEKKNDSVMRLVEIIWSQTTLCEKPSRGKHYYKADNKRPSNIPLLASKVGGSLKQIRPNWQTLNHRGQQALILFLGRKVCTSVPQVLLIQLWNSWFIWFLFLLHYPKFGWFLREASFASLLLNFWGTILQRRTVDWHPWPNFELFLLCSI